jgi:hypothetical protein
LSEGILKGDTLGSIISNGRDTESWGLIFYSNLGCIAVLQQ